MARGASIALAVALAGTLLMAAPIAQAPAERVFGDAATLVPGDPNADTLVVIDQFRTGHVGPPYLQPMTDLPGRALAALFGPVVAYNLVILSTFPFAAAAGYLLARHVAGSHLAALVAGLVYAFLPFHVMQAAGHPHVAQTHWLPLYFLALWRCVDRPQPGRAALLVAAAAAVTLSNFYGGWIAAVLTPVALLGYGLVAARAGTQAWLRVAKTALVLGGVAVGTLLLAVRFAPQALHDPQALAVQRSELFVWSAKWWSGLVPPVEHPVLGPGVRAFWARHGLTDVFEQQLSLGWGALLLAAVPLTLALRGRRDHAGMRHAPALLLLGGAAVVCSLSPERSVGALTFVRPSALLYELTPMFRAYARFGVVTGLMTALLAGAGFELLWRRNARGRACAALLLGLTAFEFWPGPPWRWRDVLPTAAHRWLAAQPGPLRVLDCVPPVRYSDLLALPLLGHDASLLGPADDDCGEPGLADKLRAAAWTHVVVRDGSRALARLDAGGLAEGLVRGPRFDDAAVFRVAAGPPRPHVAELRGFFTREYKGALSWRWMSRAATLEIAGPGAGSGVVLELELRAFPRARRVSWFLDDRPQGTLDVGIDWDRHELRLGPLGRGRTRLLLVSQEESVVADHELHNGDPRPLAIAVGRWSFRGSL